MSYCLTGQCALGWSASHPVARGTTAKRSIVSTSPLAPVHETVQLACSKPTCCRMLGPGLVAVLQRTSLLYLAPSVLSTLQRGMTVFV